MRWQTLWQAKWILLVLVLATAGAWRLAPWLAVLPAAFLAFTLYFFRDPQRDIPTGENMVVSPADGRVSVPRQAPMRPRPHVRRSDEVFSRLANP